MADIMRADNPHRTSPAEVEMWKKIHLHEVPLHAHFRLSRLLKQHGLQYILGEIEHNYPLPAPANNDGSPAVYPPLKRSLPVNVLRLTINKTLRPETRKPMSSERLTALILLGIVAAGMVYSLWR